MSKKKSKIKTPGKVQAQNATPELTWIKRNLFTHSIFIFVTLTYMVGTSVTAIINMGLTGWVMVGYFWAFAALFILGGLNDNQDKNHS